MARAALALFEATGEDGLPAPRPRMGGGGGAPLRRARRAAATSPPPTTPSDVLVRGRTAGDNATPSGNGLMAEVQARLFHLTGDDRWRAAAEAHDRRLRRQRQRAGRHAGAARRLRPADGGGERGGRRSARRPCDRGAGPRRADASRPGARAAARARPGRPAAGPPRRRQGHRRRAPRRGLCLPRRRLLAAGDRPGGALRGPGAPGGAAWSSRPGRRVRRAGSRRITIDETRRCWRWVCGLA